MENNNSKNLVIGLAVAAAIFLGVGIYSYVDGNATAEALTQEKTAIQADLKKMTASYEKALGENTSMTAELKAAKAEVESLNEKIAAMSAKNAKDMKYYKGHVWRLKKDNKELLAKVDSLTMLNEALAADLVVAAEVIAVKTVENEELTLMAAGLAEKVALGSMLDVTSVSVEGVKSLSTGELKVTNRFKKVEAMKVSFSVAQNLIAEPGERAAYFVVKDASGNVIAPAGTIDVDGTEVSYTDEMVVDFENEGVEAISLINVDKGVLSKGVYTVDVYFEGVLAGSAEVELKSAVLGIF
ncbi:hypothetical protein N9L20_03535 [Flavobacteriaceae bacterium]|nr:hypothetical protein [Flavobacteriaceae bacterium]